MLDNIKLNEKTLLSIIDAIIVALDKDGNVKFINKSGCDILEYTHEEILGKNWFDTILVKDEQPRVRGIFSDMMDGRTEEHRTAKNHVLTKFGHMKIIKWYNSVLKDESDNVIGTISSGLDVTAEEMTQRKFEEIIDAFPDTILIIANDKRLIEIYPRCNQEKYPAMYHMIGNSIINYIGKFGGEEHAQEVNDILDHISEDRSKEYSLKATVKTVLFGDRVFDMTFKAFNDDKFLAILRDITEKEKLQILIDFQAAIDKLSENNRKAMNTLFKQPAGE